MNLSLSFFVSSDMICLIAFFLTYLQVVFVVFLMAVPLSHCNTLRNAFTEEDLTPTVENLKGDSKEEQTAMADYFHQKRSDLQKHINAFSCECKKRIHETLKQCCPDSCTTTYNVNCKKFFCTSCHH